MRLLLVLSNNYEILADSKMLNNKSFVSIFSKEASNLFVLTWKPKTPHPFVVDAWTGFGLGMLPRKIQRLYSIWFSVIQNICSDKQRSCEFVEDLKTIESNLND